MESLPGIFWGELVGDVPAGYKVGWGVVGSDAPFVVAKDHVHDRGGRFGVGI